MHCINTLLAFIANHPGEAYGSVFLIAFSESLALVGLVVPGTVIMFGVGAIVATGSLGLAPVLALAAAGAIAGDGVSFWLGRHYKETLRGIGPFAGYPEILRNGEAFFHRHGGKSVLFGRFVGPVRPVIPMVAGMLGMTPGQFVLVNVLSAIGWAFAYVLPGVFFGASLAVAGTISVRLAALVFIPVAGVWGVIWSVRKLALLLEHKAPLWLSNLKNRAAADASDRGLIQYLKRVFSFLFLHLQGEGLFVIFLVVLLFLSGWGFSAILQDVLARDPLVVVDQAVYHFFRSLRIHWANNVFVAITELGDSFVNVLLSLAVLLTLMVKRRWRAAGFWVLAVAGGLLGVQFLKWTLHLPRPVDIYQGTSAYSFPSGHTTMSVIIYGFLAILLAGGLSGRGRWGLFAGAMGASFVIGISRLYLGAHWLSDVLGGLMFGAAWSALLGIAYLKGAVEHVPRRLLGIVTILVVVIAGGWHITQRHEKDMALYAPRRAIASMPGTTWQTGGWRDLPAWRIDMEGEREQPLAVQWAGSPDELARFLRAEGWRQPPSLTLKTFLGMLSPAASIGDLPVLPELHDGVAERLCLVNVRKDKRLVLRLWTTNLIIEPGSLPLMTGAVEEQKISRLADLIVMARDTGERERPLNMLGQMLEKGFAVKMVARNVDKPDSDDPGGVSRRGKTLLAGAGFAL